MKNKICLIEFKDNDFENIVQAIKVLMDHEHTFPMVNQITVSTPEPTFREVMEWLKKCGWFQKIINIDKILGLYKNDKEVR